MPILIPDYAFDGMTAEQAQEILGVLGSLEQLLTKEETELLFQQTAQKFADADIEILSDPIGHVYLDTGTKLAGEYIPPVASTTKTAIEMAEEAWEGYNTAVLDKYGNVIYRYNSGQGAMAVETAGQATQYQTTALMSLDLGMVGAAVAPILGVAIGANIEQQNPAFWTQLSQKLLPFCYPGTTRIPAWLDIVESAIPEEYECHGVIDKAIVNALRQWFIDEHYITEWDEEQVDTTGTQLVDPLYWSEVDEGFTVGSIHLVRTSGSGPIRVANFYHTEFTRMWIAASEAPSTLEWHSGTGRFFSFMTTEPYTIDGKTVYCGSQFASGQTSSKLMDATVEISALQSVDNRVVAWFLLYGLSSALVNPPEGASAWDGVKGTLDSYVKKIVRFVEDGQGGYDIEESDGIEITLQKKKKSFEGDNPSYSSPDPNHEPSPNQTKNPQNAISNLENTAPGNNVNPAEETQPEPQTDPSLPTTTITPVIPADPPGTPGIDPPPPDDGSSPPSILPVIPLPFSPTNDGLISVYHPTDAQLKAFASWLWVTYADPSIQKLWNNPFDGVIGLMEIYCTPTDIGSKTIRSGFLDSGVSSAIISRYTEINCGTIFIPEYYRNYFDYSPYSKAHVYLPFIGIVELNVDDVVGHGINITYKIDEYNGSCIAQIRVAKYTEVNGEPVTYDNIMYQFSGNCAVELPLAGGTQAAIRAGMIQAAAYGLSSVIGGIVSGVSGNIGGAISQIGYGAANAIGSVVSAKSSVQHSGSFGSSFGALGCKIPYIVISRPKQLQVYNYNELYGFPAHCSVTIGACTGFLRVREVNVMSATASDEEKAKIESLLKEGVYV